MGAEPLSRRELFTGRVAAKPVRIRPPGVSDLSLAACTGCGACAERCPTGIIRLEGGLPFVDFSGGECTFCGACAQACPEPVFEAKDVRRFPHVASIADTCLARRYVACQSCGESCPEQAIRFRPRMGGPFLPELDEAKCTGCGACLGGCPVSAIVVKALEAEVAHV
ncbi:ferredoxin-type protein NapF [Ensifer adhaerens]|uniref:ferredoxin-type protein NapF n=1 Tax=Ensifer adhaerens TaxID=106592 RepID=UPI001CBE3E7C|nr:ferredoxin-type protein NapF [Ensifer adhaerens]MBZ7922257.1 ferredoxin-type protein NapF [Ensifer adhaerens]UAX90899.1 ferredoxin-type protein NapF [Ensifer adhaerens]UAX98528.1 ferredoxin-type protein NapF [Ensifer adhaerens]UAY05909.1 ferredoxin-type protein NapF [Ensifer adhaerens]